MKAGTINIALLLIFLVVMPSCGDKEKPDKDLLIPEAVLINILTDTYIAEGLMDVTPVREMYRYRDTISNNRDILSQYGYTRPQMDSTLKYYFLYKPKKLEKIYDQVTGKLLEMEATITSDGSSGKTNDSKNLWNGKVSYAFSDDNELDSVAFSIVISEPGLYRFKALYLLFPDDESIDPKIVLYYSCIKDDGTEFRINWEPYKIKKDGRSNQVTLTKELDFSGKVTLNGCLLSQSNKSINRKRHARIMDISLEKDTRLVRELK